MRPNRILLALFTLLAALLLLHGCVSRFNSTVRPKLLQAVLGDLWRSGAGYRVVLKNFEGF